jgi:hypothetical protein
VPPALREIIKQIPHAQVASIDHCPASVSGSFADLSGLFGPISSFFFQFF